MIRSLHIAATGMQAQQTQLDNISHNLANVGSNGFKRGHVVFEDLIYQNLRQAGANSSEETQLPTGLQVGLGVRPVATTRIFSQGNLQQSSNPLDLAIKGNGFFQIQLPDGTTAYTRDGGFQVDSQGQLVNNAGYVVQPGITIPANAQSVTIAPDGTVSAQLPGPGRGAGHRPVAARVVRQSGRPRSEGRQPVRRDRGLRHAERAARRAATASACCSKDSSRRAT